MTAASVFDLEKVLDVSRPKSHTGAIRHRALASNIASVGELQNNGSRIKDIVSGMDPQDIAKLKAFVAVVESKPELLHSPQLAFFKRYLEKLNATIPPPSSKSEPEEVKEDAPKTEQAAPEPEVESDPESEVELDNSGVIEKDDDLGLEQGDSSKAVSDDDMEKAGELRSQAQQALGEGKVDESLKLWTEAIVLNPQSAVFFAKRAQCLVKMQKPFNAIKDCSKAIELNPDQALAYRLRGRAHALLGNWEQAALDLNTSLKIDYNEEGDQWLKEVAPNAKKLHDHKRKYERKREEKELRERKERIRRAQEERQKAAESEGAAFGGFPGGMPDGFPGGMPGGMPGGFPGGMPGGMPGGGKMPPNMGGMFAEWMKDPEIQEGLSDPEIAAALQELSKDPSSLLKNQSNPKVMAFMAKMSSKMGFKPH